MILMGGAVPFLLPALRRYCLPYVPASTAQVQNVMAGLKSRPAAWKSGGPNQRLWLVLWSRMRALYNGVSKQTEFHRQDISGR